MLHETPIFAAPDSGQPPYRDLPVMRELADRLFTIPAFAEVPERYVRACARALRKVAACASVMGELSMSRSRSRDSLGSGERARCTA